LVLVFRLATFLGKTVSELLDSISWDEFIYWQAYMHLEPPERAANQRTAAILAQITNMSGKSLRDGKTVTAEDFLGTKKKQTMEEQIQFMKSIGGGE
jgi:hypothetical protein